MKEFETQFAHLNSLLDKKEGEFDKMKTTIAVKLKEVEQQFIEANNEMRQ